MANLLDLMTPEDREAVEVAFKKRMSGDNTFRKGKVSRVAYLLAELGMLYGWEAIVAAKRGYIETFDDYVNYARIVCVGTGSAFSKNPNETLRDGMKPFIDGVSK